MSASAFANVVPFAGGPSLQMSIDGRRQLPGESQPIVSYVTIRGRYFDTLGLRLLRGRTFTDRDGLPGSESAIVSHRGSTSEAALQNSGTPRSGHSSDKNGWGEGSRDWIGTRMA